jgi:hypothetical protein
VVRVPMALGDVGVAGLGQGFSERVIAWREAFAGGDDEDGTRRDLRGEVQEVERLLVRADLAGERQAAGAGEWREVAVETNRLCFLFDSKRASPGRRRFLKPRLIFQAEMRTAAATCGLCAMAEAAMYPPMLWPMTTMRCVSMRYF